VVWAILPKEGAGNREEREREEEEEWHQVR